MWRLGRCGKCFIRLILCEGSFADTAVLVNEFGAVGIDQQLMESAKQDVLLLKNGCLCCGLQGDFLNQVRDLLDRRSQGYITSFNQLVIETTGFADPIPIICGFFTDPGLASCFAPPAVVTVVDRIHFLNNQLLQQVIVYRQIACADLLIISKADQLAVSVKTNVVERLSSFNRAPFQFPLMRNASPQINFLKSWYLETINGKHCLQALTYMIVPNLLAL
ncbi:hypothetical protein N9383_05860 [Granulosicoccus sp.]|nr:hypothetical protein [Granulosicoccus sp.]